MGVTTTQTNKPLNPRGNDQSPLAYNRAKLFSGKALDFDGVNDNVNAGILDITGYTAISMSGYIKKRGTNTQVPIGITHTGNDDIRFVVRESIEVGVDDGTYYQVSIPINSNEWYFVVLTFDGTTLKGYLNGVNFGSIAASFDFSTANGQVSVGRRFNGSLPYDGEFANAKVFNTALTAAQVADLYNNPEKVVPTGVDNTALKLWLPMQEGAGTTAYDGSGNGNHGTISGATYTHGIGAPVSQTAVIDWNKGTNLVKYSHDFWSAGWALAYANGGTIPVRTFNYAEAPDGTQTATRIQMDRGTNGAGYSQVYQYPINVTSGQLHVYSVWAKSLSGTPTISIIGDGGRPAVTLTNEWVRYSGTYTPSSSSSQAEIAILGSTYSVGNSETADILVWGYQIEEASSVGAYVRSFATPITSDVLLPQGLTTGRDITGVNLFENVRKQGALNLDGNSWAEVHDNASLDMTTAQTLECWINYSGTSVSGASVLLGKWGLSGSFAYLMYINTIANKMYYTFSSTGNNVLVNISGSILLSNGWNHIVAVKSATDVKYYVNGAIDSTHSSTDTIFNAATPVQIGRNENGSNYSSDQIAQPRIYNRALTAEEVQRNYNAGKNIYTN